MNNFPIFKVAHVLLSLTGEVQIDLEAQPIPATYQSIERLAVSFTSQAPEGIWTEPWQNACEESAILMVAAFYRGEVLNPITSKEKILSIFNIKNDKIGASLDENAATMVQLIDLLDTTFEGYIKDNPTKEDLIAEVSTGRPVILPVFGHELPNPHYQSPAPDYHVVVLMGYDQAKGVFIIHDPGTRFGEAMEFPYEVILEAIHDLKSPDYSSGDKKVIFTQPVNK